MKNGQLNQAYKELGFTSSEELEALNMKVGKMHATLMAAGDVTMIDVIKEIEQFEVPVCQKILVALTYQKKIDGDKFSQALLQRMFPGGF